MPTLAEQNPDAPNPAPHAPQRLADAGGMFSLGGVEAEVLDEAAERRAFQEAVAQWRSGNNNAPPSPLHRAAAVCWTVNTTGRRAAFRGGGGWRTRAPPSRAKQRRRRRGEYRRPDGQRRRRRARGQLDTMNARRGVITTAAEGRPRRRSRRSSGRARASRSFWRPSTPTRRRGCAAIAHCARDDGAREQPGADEAAY